MNAEHVRICAVVLAGGDSRRFGSDKLSAALGGHTLLDRTLAGLPECADILVVGPDRPVSRAARFVREDPPGGGPTAGLIAGLVSGLNAGLELATKGRYEQFVVLPGDAPLAGKGAAMLLDALRHSECQVVVAIDPQGREQPLQLALTRAGAEAVIALAGPERGHGESARRLLSRLEPPPHRLALPAAQQFDIDRTDDVTTWEQGFG